jgi:hypothetical protein
LGFKSEIGPLKNLYSDNFKSAMSEDFCDEKLIDEETFLAVGGIFLEDF